MAISPTHLNRLRSTWVAVTVIAIAATLWHVIIDYQIGLYGETSSEMGVFEGLLAAMHGVLYAWWAVTVAMAYNGSRAAHISALTITIAWTLLGNSIVALIVAPPPSAAFPFQDIAHFCGLIFGGWSVYLSIRILRELPGFPAGKCRRCPLSSYWHSWRLAHRYLWRICSDSPVPCHHGSTPIWL